MFALAVIATLSAGSMGNDGIRRCGPSLGKTLDPRAVRLRIPKAVVTQVNTRKLPAAAIRRNRKLSRDYVQSLRVGSPAAVQGR